MANQTGKIIWMDLTVPDVGPVRDFYQQVVGWTPQPVEIEGYDDYNMVAPEGEAVAGICHKRGFNAAQPSQWMIYITVDDLDRSLAACEANGGRVVVPTRGGDGHRFAVIEDPAGAVCTLYETRTA
jgi:predicted enzyme related to lactoylglutathione lyase